MEPDDQKKRSVGRPKVADEQKRQNLICRVSPETRHWLEAQRTKTKISIGEIIDRAVESLQKDLSSFIWE